MDANKWNPEGSRLYSTAGMWATWQQKVKDALPLFCADCVFVGQGPFETDEDYEKVAEEVSHHGVIYDPEGVARDIEFGGRVVNTRAVGPTTRMWLDSNIECNFLAKHLDITKLNMLDIGAGYGRLAVVMRRYVTDYTCVDAIPISSFICDYYTRRFAPSVRVLTLREYESDSRHYDVAINIHSWNECSIDQITAWLDKLCDRKVRYLFTVPHNEDGGRPPGWRAHGGLSFLVQLESRYEVVAQERLGFGCQHVLWERK